MQNRTTSHLTRNHLTFCYYLFFNQQTLNVLTSLHFTSFSQHLRGLAPRIFVQLTHRSESGLSQVDFNWKSSIEKLQCNFPRDETWFAGRALVNAGHKHRYGSEHRANQHHRSDRGYQYHRVPRQRELGLFLTRPPRRCGRHRRCFDRHPCQFARGKRFKIIAVCIIWAFSTRNALTACIFVETGFATTALGVLNYGARPELIPVVSSTILAPFAWIVAIILLVRSFATFLAFI